MGKCKHMRKESEGFERKSHRECSVAFSDLLVRGCHRDSESFTGSQCAFYG